MIVSNVSNPFFIDVFRSLDAAARERGYDVLVENTDYKVDQLMASVRSMLGRRVSGLALIVSEMSQDVIDEIHKSGLPAVFYDVGVSGPGSANVRVRYETGMQRVVQYLYALGHRRMAFVGHHAGLSPLQVREKVFVETIRQFGPGVTYRTALSVDSPAGGIAAVRELRGSGFDATAIVCVNDYMAVGVLRELRAAGLATPGDVSVTGFDNIEFSEFTNPALTTVNIPRASIGQMTLDALLRDPTATSGNDLLLEPELVVRDSTGPAKA
jgi:DNA-binding LacI/PurR family transcriptional regulator